MLFYIVHKRFPWAQYFTVILYLLPQQLSDGVEGNYLFSSTCLFYAIHEHKVAQGTSLNWDWKQIIFASKYWTLFTV